MNRNREPKGSNLGGRFAKGANPESRIRLAPESSSGWTAITYEERYLDESEVDDFVPRGKKFSVRQPYYAAVVPEIADVATVDMPSEVLADAAEAAAEIARFDAELSGEFASFTAILLRS